jgi:RNA polymerase sigma-70 factor (ECF subfamily)
MEAKETHLQKKFNPFLRGFLFAKRRTSRHKLRVARMSDELIPTRATLIQRLKDWQDQPSWQEFSDTYWKLIYGVALKGGLTPTEAKDAAQETMISVAKHIATFEYDPAIGSFKAWLLNMTRWRITDQIRKRGPLATEQESAGQTACEVAELSSDLDKLWDAEWETNLLEAAVAKAKRQVDPKHYQIFDLCVHKEWPPNKIAKTFAISTAQVYLAKHRVTEKIRQEVERLRNEIV